MHEQTGNNELTRRLAFSCFRVAPFPQFTVLSTNYVKNTHEYGNTNHSGMTVIDQISILPQA